MIYFTKYAEKKFIILNKYGVYFTREQIENIIKNANNFRKKGEYYYVDDAGIGIIYKKNDNLKMVVTFYPVKICK